MLRNEDEDELKQILSQTFTNNNYIDQEISQLLMPSDELLLRSKESSESFKSSEGSENSQVKEEHHFMYTPEQNEIHQFEVYQEKSNDQIIIQPEVNIHIFDDIYQQINSNLRADSLETVRQKYPLFLLSQPNYQIKGHIKQINLAFSGGLLRKNILVIDAGYCESEKVYKVAAGTDEGHVVIFQPNSSKPQQIVDCFNKICSITCVKWSANLQYLAISNDEKQLYVYCFKQAIMIQNHVSFRILKTPTELFGLNQKTLKKTINQLYFIEQSPFEMVVVDEGQQIFKIQMKKHFINFRPHLTPIPVKFNNFLDLHFLTTTDHHNNKGVFMAVSGFQFVTICLVEPTFEVAMVYDKQKHGGHLIKNGHPQISFRSNPSSIMIIWDKYLQILSIQVESFYPLVHRIAITHKFLLPDSTIIGGLISNSMMYQVSRVGLKIYSVTTFQKDLSHQFKNQQVHTQKINFSSFCYGDTVEQFITNHTIAIQDLRFLKGLFHVTHRTLFYSLNTGIQMVYFNTLQQYVTNLIQNNNWKVAIQLLKDCYMGHVYQLDEIHPSQIKNKIKQVTSRYVNFLQTVIVPSDDSVNNTDLLWNQELIFVINILLITDLQMYLLDQMLVKIKKLSPAYLLNLIPFIKTNKIFKITHSSLQLMLETLPKQIVSKLIFCLQISNNDPQLPHQINNLLIRNEMLLQLVDLNQKFQDHYTPLAVMVGAYLKIQQEKSGLIEMTAKKRQYGRLLAYSVYDTFLSINFGKQTKHQSLGIMQAVIPLLTDQIFAILVREQPKGLFQLILQQLYMGNCLQHLNQLDTQQFDNDYMLSILKSISYSQVIDNHCQKLYWITVLQLVGRRIIVDFQIFVGLKYLTINDHVETIYMHKYVTKCQDFISKEMKTISVDVLNQYFEQLLRTEHICLVILIGKILKKYIDVLHAMLSCQSQRNIQLYNFLDECLSSLSPNDLQQLRTILKQNIKLFTSIDPNKASDIVCKYFLPDLNIFIDDLNQYPHEQLRLIRAVLQLYAYKQSLTTLKIKYLELLAITGQHAQILTQLQKENYPLDQSLFICKKYDVLEAVGYLLVKSGGQGSTEAAIRVYFRIIWQKIIQRILKDKEQQLQSDLHKIVINFVKICIDICLELDLKFQHHYDNQWFIILEQLQILKKNIFKNLIIDSHTCDFLRKIINFYAFPALVSTLITELAHPNILQYLHDTMGKFDVEAIQIIIQEMVKSYAYEKRMFVVAQQLFVDTQNAFRKQLFQKQLKGFRTDTICDVCAQKGDLLVKYGCGHQIHPSCGQDVKQCILCCQQTQMIYQRKINNVVKLRVDIYSGGVKGNLQQVQQQISKQQKMNKLQYFWVASNISID